MHSADISNWVVSVKCKWAGLVIVLWLLLIPGAAPRPRTSWPPSQQQIISVTAFILEPLFQRHSMYGWSPQYGFKGRCGRYQLHCFLLFLLSESASPQMILSVQTALTYRPYLSSPLQLPHSWACPWDVCFLFVPSSPSSTSPCCSVVFSSTQKIRGWPHSVFCCESTGETEIEMLTINRYRLRFSVYGREKQEAFVATSLWKQKLAFSWTCFCWF